ncbi:hypothetical protein [Pedobacter heparinus]|uniref:hypothetical protein n=1 Tax=Pedobacter heparinus TaxID=984 RepID=UPI0029303FBD|nr:hypothetical protein [Pedobacter heparinus]
MNKTSTAILKTGIIVGSLDILLAFANAWFGSGISPTRVLQFIASGVMGEKAFQYSYGITLLGLAIHFFIAIFWTALFFIIYNRFKRIVRTPLLQSVFYGLFVWFVMNVLVLPLSNVPKSNFQWLEAIKSVVILIIAIGLPLVYFARQYYSGKIV